MKRALCLQGGGAKGAFQAGALKALKERGYKFDCAVGASVGALNAAMYALGKTDELFDLWNELDFTDVIDVERRAEDGKYSLRSIASSAIGALRSGVDTAKIRSIIAKYVDEDKLRASRIGFGLVTVQDGKPRVLRELFLEDIPQGRLHDYMMASAALPFFKKVEIDGVRYLDGGMMDNLPLAMLVKKGYRKITAIRLGGDLRYEDTKGVSPDILYIDPTESPGHTVNFSNVSIRRSLQLGYYDTLRRLDGLLGRKYYIKPFGEKDVYAFLASKRSFTERALEYLNVRIEGGKKAKSAMLLLSLSRLLHTEGSGAVDVWLKFTECFAAFYGVERWQVYTLKSFLRALALAGKKENKETKGDEDQVKAAMIARILIEEMNDGR